MRRQMRTEEGDLPFYLSFSDDGRRMATVEFHRREAVVWEVATGRTLARVPLATDGEASDLGADGSTLYTAGSDGALRHWDVDGGRRFVSQVAYAPLKLARPLLRPTVARRPVPRISGWRRNRLLRRHDGPGRRNRLPGPGLPPARQRAVAPGRRPLRGRQRRRDPGVGRPYRPARRTGPAGGQVRLGPRLQHGRQPAGHRRAVGGSDHARLGRPHPRGTAGQARRCRCDRSAWGRTTGRPSR